MEKYRHLLYPFSYLVVDSVIASKKATVLLVATVFVVAGRATERLFVLLLLRNGSDHKYADAGMFKIIQLTWNFSIKINVLLLCRPCGYIGVNALQASAFLVHLIYFYLYVHFIYLVFQCCLSAKSRLQETYKSHEARDWHHHIVLLNWIDAGSWNQCHFAAVLSYVQQALNLFRPSLNTSHS